MRRGQDPLPWSFWLLVAPGELGADTDFLLEFDTRLEEVLKVPQLVSVQIVHRIERLGGVITHVAQKLADMGPVLLFDMSVVVFLVRTAAGELDLAVLTAPP